MKYVVCGTATVVGKTYGEKIDADELEGVNVDALIVGGHIKPATATTTTTSTTTTKADEADDPKD